MNAYLSNSATRVQMKFENFDFFGLVLMGIYNLVAFLVNLARNYGNLMAQSDCSKYIYITFQTWAVLFTLFKEIEYVDVFRDFYIFTFLETSIYLFIYFNLMQGAFEYSSIGLALYKFIIINFIIIIIISGWSQLIM